MKHQSDKRQYTPFWCDVNTMQNIPSQIIHSLPFYLGNFRDMKLDKVQTYILSSKKMPLWMHATDFNDNLWHTERVNKENWILDRPSAFF
jgi:hypothetical protein